MPTILNCEGEPCPNPVLRCKQVIADPATKDVRVIVDNEAAKENVSRFLVSQRWRIDETSQDGQLWTIAARPASGASEASGPAPAQDTHQPACPLCGHRILIFLTSDVIGRGDDALGARLMQNFLTTLPELGDALWRIIMVNGAVRLATAQNPAIDKLKSLEAAGVSILVCGTCLEHFQLMDQKVVGQVTNMLDVVTSQQVADKVVTI